MYDVIVIGVGAAGSSAGIYIARARLKTLMIGDPASSRLARAHSIDNYLGFPDGISGSTLIELGFAQAQRFGAEVVLGEVVSIKPEEPFAVELATGERFESASIVLATGTSSKSSGIKNETELTGRGVSYCVTCDAFFYRGKRVVVIGDGNFAAKETLELLPFTRDVTLCSNGKAFEISDSLRAELAQVGVVLADYRVSEFLGN
ncbi:MAG: FAD-dependent oxidoreductase, partial [Chloroflexi bacterium]|nr:FAD-dependent oxidoreductase [Chloroflexota bacterium]